MADFYIAGARSYPLILFSQSPLALAQKPRRTTLYKTLGETQKLYKDFVQIEFSQAPRDQNGVIYCYSIFASINYHILFKNRLLISAK